MEIGNIDVVISKKKQFKHFSKAQHLVVMSKKTKEGLDKNKPATDAELLDFDDVKQFIRMHKKTLFKDAKHYQINILSPIGWRGTERFTDSPNWETLENQYGDKFRKINSITAIEIIYWM